MNSKITPIVIILFISAMLFTGCKQKEVADYVYPITPESETWDDYETVSERIEALRIPQETLEQLSNDQLVKATLDFPYIIDLFLSSSTDLKPSVEITLDKCDALKELVSREDGMDTLKQWAESENYTSLHNDLDEEILDILVEYLPKVIE